MSYRPPIFRAAVNSTDAAKATAIGSGCGCGSTCASPIAPVVVSTSVAGRVDSLRIAAMDCPTEEALIRRALTPVDGILSLEFNLLQRTLQVRHTLAACRT